MLSAYLFQEVQGLPTINKTASLKRNSTEPDSSQFSNKTPQVVKEPSTGPSSSSSSGFWRFGLNILKGA